MYSYLKAGCLKGTLEWLYIVMHIKFMPKIAIGICSSNASEAAKYKFDYVESPAGEIAAMSEDQFSQYRSYMLNLIIPCRAFNKFIIKPELKIVGPDVQSDELRRYTERC